MPAGRPSKPTELKRLLGNPGQRPLPEPIVVLAASATIPPHPSSLASTGRIAWDRLWTAGQAWLSISTDVDILTRLCEAHDEREAMRDQIASDGYMVLGSMGQSRVHPLITHLRVLESQMTKWESLCGFTPSDRSRLGYAEVKRASKLDSLLASRQNRAQ